MKTRNYRFEDNVQGIIVDRIPWNVYFVDAESDDDYAILRRESYEKVTVFLNPFTY